MKFLAVYGYANGLISDLCTLRSHRNSQQVSLYMCTQKPRWSLNSINCKCHVLMFTQPWNQCDTALIETITQLQPIILFLNKEQRLKGHGWIHSRADASPQARVLEPFVTFYDAKLQLVKTFVEGKPSTISLNQACHCLLLILSYNISPSYFSTTHYVP